MADKAAEADVIIFVGGLSSALEGEEMPVDLPGFRKGDRTNIDLPQVQEEMLKALKKTGKPVVFVLCSGSTLALPWEAENLDAIIEAWYPGQQGGTAVADVLFGDYNPAGRLPLTFYASSSDLPDFEDYDMSNRTYRYFKGKPLFPFGHGLSYTTFDYGKAKADKKILRAGEGVTLTIPLKNIGKLQEKENGNITVQATVKNIGQRAGDEVVQLYVTDMYASVKTRITELKDFTRIHLKPGEAKTVSFELTPYELSLLNDHMDRVVEKGAFKILVGGVSPQYVAKDRIKDSVGYADSKKGLSGMLEYTHEFAADFGLTLFKVEENLVKNQKTIWVSVKNNGTLMDTGKIEMYVGGKKVGNNVHYELAPGEEKLIPFSVDKENTDPVIFTTKYKVLSI